jgi:hypothetical protein
MLYKLEAYKPWAKLEQVGHDVEKLAEKADKLETEGWKVNVFPLGNLTIEQYGAIVLDDCMEKLFPANDVVQISH